MAEQRSGDDLLRSRREAALLLRLDPTNLSPSDVLRCDLVASLRLVVDDASATVLDGRAPDLARLLTATKTLIKLLPAEPKTESQQHGDPRVVLWNIIKEGRDRAALGFEGYDGKVKQIEVLQAELAAKDAELAALRAGDLRDLSVVDNSKPAKAAINPPLSDIVPPGEIGELYAGVRPGLDDPPPPPIIEGVAVKRPTPPAAAAPAPRPAAPAYDYNKERGWRDYVLPSGEITQTPFGGSRRWWGPV